MNSCRRRAVAVIVVFATLLMGASPASAYWSAAGSATATAVTGTLAAPLDVTAEQPVGADVTVRWVRGAEGIEPEGYYVTRDASGAVTPACGSSPASLVIATSCADIRVTGESVSYTVTAVYSSWTAASAPSALVSSFLGAAHAYSVLAVTAVTSTGSTAVSGDLGVSTIPGVSGFGPGTVGGDIHPGDAHAASAHTAFRSASDDLAARTQGAALVGDLGGRTLVPGTYGSVAALALTGRLTLDAQGDPDALFIFQAGAAFNLAAASSVVLINGARASNVFWVVTGAVGTGAGSSLSGNILAEGAITLGAGTVLIGRALSAGAVTLAGNDIRFTDAPPPTITIDGGTPLVTKNITPTITGTTSAASMSPVSVTVAGQTLRTTVTPEGTWTVTAAALTAGQHEIAAKVRDPAGNGNRATLLMTVEINPPSIALGSAGSFSVYGATGVVNTGATVMSGDMGVGPGAAWTGFPPGIVSGDVVSGDARADAAARDLAAAMADGRGRTAHTRIVGDLGGRTFHVGVHHSTAALGLTGNVILDGEGDPGAVFIFQTDAAFNTAAGSTVTLVNGAQAANVFWVVSGAAGAGATSSLAGTIMAAGAITLGAGTALAGQALSLGTVTLAGNTMNGVVPASVVDRSAPDAVTETPVGPETPAATTARGGWRREL